MVLSKGLDILEWLFERPNDPPKANTPADRATGGGGDG